MKTKVVIALLALCTLGVAQVEVVHVFPGPNGPNPPDAGQLSAEMMGGVGPRHLVGFTNGGVSIRNKADGKEVVPFQTQREFWNAAFKNTGAELQGKPYDPRIFFDPLTNRWFALADSWLNAPSNHMLIGISTDADPTHPWKAVDLEARVPVDNIKLGLDKNGFYSAETGGVRGDKPLAAVLAIPKADLLWKGDGKPNQGVSTSGYSTTVLDPSDPTLFWSNQFAATIDCLPKEENAGKYGTNWVAFRVGTGGKKSK
jgi:hypothetical protein